MLGFLLAMSVTMALIPPLMRAAVRFNFLDVHATPVPRVGGIAMAVGTLLALTLSGEFAQPMPAYLAAIIVLLAFGVWDDRVTLNATTKFAGQIIAVLIVMIWGGVEISTLTLTERYVLPQWIGLPLTMVFLLGVTNAINLADGLDGLAGGTTLLSLCALALLAFTSGNPFVGAVAIVTTGAILGFLRFNTHPARVFMGDGGSQILGLSAGVLAVVLTQDRSAPLSSALPLLLLGIPIVDTLMVMTQRIIAGHSPFHADRNHIHHRLLALGFDHHEAVMAIYVLQGGLFLTAWYLRYESDLTIVAIFGTVSLATVGLLYGAAHAGWRWRAEVPSSTTSTSTLARAVRWLRMPQHVPYWSLLSIATAITVFFARVTVSCPIPSMDVRIMAGLLAVLLVGSLAWRWKAAAPGWIDQGVLYVATVMAVYFDKQIDVGHASLTAIEWVIYSVLILSIVARFRLSSDRRFRVTPLDVLVIFVAVAVPNLPGSIATAATLGESIAKLIALLYGLETLLGAPARAWRLPGAAALVFLVACATRGML